MIAVSIADLMTLFSTCVTFFSLGLAIGWYLRSIKK